MREIDIERLKDFQEETRELCEEYASENSNLTTSDFQGALEGLINKYKNKFGTR